MTDIEWTNVTILQAQTYQCGYCGKVVAPNHGIHAKNHTGYRIYICSFCRQPTYINAANKQTPGVAYGNDVDHLPQDIKALYNEARNCISVGSFTATVLCCRKLLMNIAISQGAQTNQTFISYVEYLANSGYVPPNGRGWVDHIRRKGNEATHEIILMTQNDAQELVTFVEMLLKFIFEFPNRIPQAKS